MKLKRTIALLMTLAMLLSALPMYGLATDGVTEPVCTCTSDENGNHIEGCALWTKPEEEQPTKEVMEHSQAKSENEVKEGSGDEVKEEPEGEAKDEVKEEPEGEAKDEVKEEPEGEAKDEVKEEPEGEAKDEVKEAPEGEPKDEVKEESEDEPKDEVKEEAKEESEIVESESTIPEEEKTDTKEPAPFYQMLISEKSLRSMVMYAKENDKAFEELTEKEVKVAENRIDELFAGLKSPTEDERNDYRTMRAYMIESRERLGMCTCGSSLNDHSFFCPLYQEYPSVIPAGTATDSPKMARMTKKARSSNQEPIIVDKWASEMVDGKATLTMEAYATGTTTTTQYVKPADMVIVVDQSASMMYADVPTFINGKPGIPTEGEERYTRKNLEHNATAQRNASHGLYYMALGDQTLCFLAYKDGKWKYFDTYLRFQNTEEANKQANFNNKYNANISGYWDSWMEAAAPTWDFVNSHTYDMTDELWERFERNGIHATRYGSAYWALVDFLEDISKTGVAHRIAIVGFAGREEGETEILCELQDVSTDAGKNAVRAAIDDILCTGVSTHHDGGILKANTIFSENEIDLNVRDRNIFFFSDGEASGGTDDDKSLSQANIAKKTHGAKVYSIGTAKAPPKLMEYLSSNYPDSTSTSSLGTKVSSDYYFHASSASGLKEIFGKLSSTVGTTSTTLGTTAFIQDVVTQYFKIPDDATAIRAYTVKCTGYANGVPQWSTEHVSVPAANIVREGSTVKVNGFDYAANFVSDGGRKEGTTDEQGDFHGRKLVVEVDVVPHEDFLGGNQVLTNTDSSGLYDGAGNLVKPFPVPNVDVKLADIKLTIPDLYSYLGSDAFKCLTKQKINKPFTIWNGEHPIAVDTSKEDFGLSWQDDYADIAFTLIDANGTPMTNGIEDIREDTKYSLKVTITPKNTGTYPQEIESDQADIYVFYPELTFKDKTYWYGENVPTSADLQDAKVALKWRLKDLQEGHVIYSTAPLFATGVAQLIGGEPTVNFTCTPDATGTLPKADVSVDVVLSKVGYIEVNKPVSGDNPNNYGFFKWQACIPECGLSVADHTSNAANMTEFYLHMNNCRLTITKKGGASDEPYVFDVYRDGKKYTEASITGNDSVTIYELPIGTYSIKEGTNWSWRYPNPSYTNDVTLSRDHDEDGITCTNTRSREYWLNGYSSVVANTFGEKKN